MRKSSGAGKQSAVERRKNASRGASRGSPAQDARAPKSRKKLSPPPSTELRLIPIPFADEIHPGDSIADKLLQALRRRRLRLQAGDILLVKHKIVSKAEGRMVALATVQPSAESTAWAK